LSPEIERALIRSQPVVALESSVIAHGLPAPANLDAAREVEQRVRAVGAVPATIAVIDGVVRIGLTDDELERLAAGGDDVRKVGPRDLAAAVVSGDCGATTVGGTLAVCAISGIHFLATGGIGGAHRGWQTSGDVSADLRELAACPVCVVCSGAKSLLDVGATLELLEALGVPVVGYRTSTFPLFYVAGSSHDVPDRAEDAATVASLVAAHWGFARTTGVLVGQPVAPDAALPEDELERWVLTALESAERERIAGAALTPYVLAKLHRLSGGATLRSNRRLLADNAALAAEVAVAYFR
ncbi:MAG TPA: pseudouridine-5'-phosphate glycosidase, partial [Gaiellales bacterium]|nr:pseudouridine-5'-phosphate glycosidase [Gaiellales bacterium]